MNEIADHLDSIMASLMALMEHVKRQAATGGPIGEVRSRLERIEERLVTVETRIAELEKPQSGQLPY